MAFVCRVSGLDVSGYYYPGDYEYEEKHSESEEKRLREKERMLLQKRLKEEEEFTKKASELANILRMHHEDFDFKMDDYPDLPWRDFDKMARLLRSIDGNSGHITSRKGYDWKKEERGMLSYYEVYLSSTKYTIMIFRDGTVKVKV